MSKFLQLTLITGLALALLAACGPADAPEPETDDSAPAAPAAAAAPESAGGFNEAPMLAAMVAAGTLPPVDERLPSEPLVIEPYNEIGQYGGTWHRFDTSSSGSHFVMAMYAYSPVHWVQDGLDKRPGLAQGWDNNEDKTEWTLYLREGAKWSDGDAFTADDFMFWWNDMVLNEEHSDVPPDYMKSADAVTAVTKMDDYTLHFAFSDPSPLFLDRLAMWPNGTIPGNEKLFVPEHYLRQFHPDYSDEETFEVLDEKLNWPSNPDAPVLNPWMPVQYDPGTRLLLDRNPYYYAVDTAGNQLPYIDSVDMTYVENLEVSKLRVIAGEQEICGRPCRYQPLSELSVFRDAEATVGLKTYLWDQGGGASFLLYPNWTHQDPQKRALYRNRDFRLGLSHAIDREKIQKIVYFGTGELTTGTMSPKAIEFTADETGKDLYRQWRDLGVAFDLDLANQLLDASGAVDADGDGFRDLPGGDELTLRIDCSAGGLENKANAQNVEIVKEGWEAAGLRVQVNAVPDEQLGVMQDNSEFDIRSCWGLGDGPNFLVFPNWVIPVDNNRWAPLYGAWYKVIGTEKEGTELDQDPLDRNPPREEPGAGDPVWRLWELYNAARVEPDDATRLALSQDIIRVHVADGPFVIGTVANTPTIVGHLDTVGNFPSYEQLGLGGFTGPWIMVYFGAVYPEQMYFKQ